LLFCPFSYILLTYLLIFNGNVSLSAQCGVTEEEKFSTDTLATGNGPYSGFEWENKAEPWLTYINVNIHFILADDCSGLTASRSDLTGLEQKEVFAKARQMIKEANDFADDMGDNVPNNQSFHGATVTNPQFVHQRYVLSGVYLHCQTSYRSLSAFAQIDGFFDGYAAYPKGLNVLLANVTNADGFTDILGGVSAVVENYSPSLLLHEIAHDLNIHHTFVLNNTFGDRCHDTWYFQDTTIQINPNHSIRARDNCWDTHPTADLDGDGSRDDLCDEDNPLVENTHVCCNEEWQNNNLMAYGLHGTQKGRATLTPCQMNIMNTHLFTAKEDFIEANDPACPPPSAIIGTLAKFDPENPTCSFDLHFEASMNVSAYRQRIFHVTSSVDSTIFFDSQLLQGRPSNDAVSYGYPFDPNKPWYVDHRLTQGKYRIQLIVENDCGVFDTASVVIDLPKCNSDTDETDPIELEVFPNPFNKSSNSELSIRYKQPANSTVKIYLSGLDVYGNYKSPQEVVDFNSQTIVNNITTKRIHANSLMIGMNYLQVIVSDEVQVRSIKVQ
jgi:hypothetical protein